MYWASIPNTTTHKTPNIYKKRNDYEAAKLGWTVVNYIMGDKGKVDMEWAKYPKGPIGSVSYYPSGVAAQGTPNNQENITGRRAYKKWLKHMMKVAQTVGYKLKDFLKYSERFLVLTNLGSFQRSSDSSIIISPTVVG